MVFSIARDTDFVQSTEKIHNRIIWAEMNIKLLKVFGLIMISIRDIHTCRVLQTIQMKLILLCVWAERAVLGSAKIALKFKY